MKQFKIRCSAIGQIMTNPRAKKDIEAGVLSSTTKNYVQEWVKEQIYGRRKDISSKYLDKGNQLEDESIEFLTANSDYGFLIKNEEHFENDFLTGTPDIITNDEVIDMKNSWDCFTFPLFFDVIPNKDYMYQLQGYMALTGRKKAKLVYTLMTTPKDINFGKEDNYDEVDAKYRIKEFVVERDDEIIQAIQNRVKQVQEYINQLNF